MNIDNNKKSNTLTGLVHEETYKKKTLISRIHQNRLQIVHRTFQKYVSLQVESWGDFGCSNGFIIEEIVNSARYQFSEIVGFDHKEELLSLARHKGIPNAVFRIMNLNELHMAQEQFFDVVTCFETLEHVGDYKNAFLNLFRHLKVKGILILSVPNEIGFSGLTKLLGRMVIRRNPYENFFEQKSFLNYLWHLIWHLEIEVFRTPSHLSYGPHLGFDYRTLKKHIFAKYIATNRLRLLEECFTFLKMNVIYVFLKNHE